MSLVGCFAVPHPPIIIPEVGGSNLADADATVRSMSALRERAAALDPDTIVLLSPHSPLARSQMGVSMAAKYKGSLAYFRAPQVRVDAEGDVALAETIMQAIRGCAGLLDSWSCMMVSASAASPSASTPHLRRSEVGQRPLYLAAMETPIWLRARGLCGESRTMILRIEGGRPISRRPEAWSGPWPARRPGWSRPPGGGSRRMGDGEASDETHSSPSSVRPAIATRRNPGSIRRRCRSFLELLPPSAPAPRPHILGRGCYSDECPGTLPPIKRPAIPPPARCGAAFSTVATGVGGASEKETVGGPERGDVPGDAGDALDELRDPAQFGLGVVVPGDDQGGDLDPDPQCLSRVMVSSTGCSRALQTLR